MPPILHPPKTDGGGVADVGPLEPLLLVLDRVDPAVVAGLTPGERVILQIDALPIVAATLLGLPIGEVRLDDVEAVRRRRARSAVVVVAQAQPPACAVETR